VMGFIAVMGYVCACSTVQFFFHCPLFSSYLVFDVTFLHDANLRPTIY